MAVVMPATAARTLLCLAGALAVLHTGCASDNPSDDDGDDDSQVDAGIEPDAQPPDDGRVDATVDAPVDAPVDAMIPADDCDPDPPIFPGAPEVADGIDNDCDGLIDELTVCAGMTHSTIGTAIAAAPAGGTIFVCGGTYNERLVIDGKAINLIGEGDTTTIIDGGAGGSTISVANTMAGVRIEGFTIRNGSAPLGGGLRCNASKLTLAGSTVTGNVASAAGGGMHATGCTLEVTTVTFNQNNGAEQGGGALLQDCSGSVTESSFTDNDAVDGGGLAMFEGSTLLSTNLFRSNTAALHGGGLYHASNAMVANNSIIDNVANWTGGGLHVVAHAATYSDNTVQGNSSPNDGGGIYVHQGTPTFRGNHIIGNTTGDDGGGLRLFESAAMVQANVIENNIAGDAGAGIRVSHVPATFMDNIVRNNDATGTGGGMDMDNDSSTVIGGEISGNHAGSGGGIYHWLGPWNGAVLVGIRFENNEAWRGGGLFLDDNFMPVTMRSLTFVGNEANKGGAIHTRATNFTLTNALFAGNDAALGGAIYDGANSAWGTTPCTTATPCPPLSPTGRIDFAVFHGNTADDGGAIWIDAPNLTVTSSIVVDNTGAAQVTLVQPTAAPDGTVRPFPTVTWRYNDTLPDSFIGMSSPTGSNGNISAAPSFMDVASGDFHLAAGSVCIDAGTPDILDADGTRADMGFFGGLQ